MNTGYGNGNSLILHALMTELIMGFHVHASGRYQLHGYFLKG
jgi:hypothetical protein